MAKNYKRKIHIINNTRDSERCNDIRKSLNSSERQQIKRELKNQLEDKGSFYDDFYYSDSDDWKAYTPLSMQTTGGRFISTLMRLGVLEGGPHKDWHDLRKNLKHQNFFYHPHYELLEKLAVSPSGIIYSDTATASKKQ